ncbi:hypothetical protein CP981_31120 [Streptomyces platensis]|uniref:Uncharacterized protein n=1 Tax=Streptomyces platensis TaxID=58346 RepID=A0AAE6NP69_STRPT|nr:hypothetical protein [Streptomyces platensis]OSY48117.1 hypothetical protein BG653_00751 [Streptomyces platensis]QEV55493.1 hypothetical protein CP981_31120 [Streptomyces platensis]
MRFLDRLVAFLRSWGSSYQWARRQARELQQTPETVHEYGVGQAGETIRLTPFDATLLWSERRPQRNLQAASSIHRLITSPGEPRLTYADLWVALAEQGVTQGLPLQDLNDPVEVTKGFYADLLSSVSAEHGLWQRVSRWQKEVLEALEGSHEPPSGPARASSLNKIKQVSAPVPDQLPEQPLDPEEAKAAALAAKENIEDALARLFLRLGPPPEPHTRAGTDDGGAQQ